MEHWDGIQWSIVASPNPGTDEMSRNRLYGVAAVSTNDVWAVGDYDSDTIGHQVLVIHWDGAQWSVVSTPALTGSPDLKGVAAVSANDVWAVGYNGVGHALTMHWDGALWSVVSSPGPVGVSQLSGVAAASGSDVWAVGSLNNAGLFQTLIEHWDGNSWSIVPSANVASDHNELKSVAIVSANDIWSVGYHADPIGGSEPLVERWNGTSWSLVSAPDPGLDDEILAGVTAVSANDVWAVGFVNGGSQASAPAVILHWNGANLSVVNGADLQCGYDQLNAVGAFSANEIWGVGTTCSRTLVERYSAQCPTPTNTPPFTPTRTSTSTPTVTRTPCSVCDLRVSDVTVACNPDGTVHWTANVFNSGSCTVANAQWGAALETRIGGGNFHPIKAQSGVSTFPPGTTTVSGDFCYAFLPNTTGMRVRFAVVDPSGRCFPNGISPIRPPCDLTIQCPP